MTDENPFASHHNGELGSDPRGSTEDASDASNPDVPLLADILAGPTGPDRRPNNGGDERKIAAGDEVGLREGPRSAEAVSEAVHHALAMVDELSQQLDRANEWAARQRGVEVSEEQIGKLVADAERIAERTVSEARRLAQEIVAQATEEANRIRSGSGLPLIELAPPQLSEPLPDRLGAGSQPEGGASSEEVRALRQALVEFSRTNAALVSGISSLVDALVEQGGSSLER